MTHSSKSNGLALLLVALLVAARVLVGLAGPAEAQSGPPPAREATGGAQTLEDIMARQAGRQVDDSAIRAELGAEAPPDAIRGPLGTLGLASNSDLFRAMRYNEGDISVVGGDPLGAILVQDDGMRWLSIREGPLQQYGAWLLYGMLAVLALFYLIRGRIRIEHGRSGQLIERFDGLERFGHWLLACSFILLAITGLVMLFGRSLLIPLFGKDAFATIALGGKWVHNNVGWAFMVALVLVFFMWVLRNIPNRQDLKWLLVGGGLFTKGLHPPSKKFNAGQKIIFWIVILLGASISVSGLSLLFPFELPIFAKTFVLLNALGAEAVLGAPLPTELTPHQEMMLAQLWHAIIAFVMTAVILAHIYLGSLGMEGAFDAMGSGHVDRNWALEHHSLWVEEEEAKSSAPPKGAAASPAE